MTRVQQVLRRRGAAAAAALVACLLLGAPLASGSPSEPEGAPAAADTPTRVPPPPPATPPTLPDGRGDPAPSPSPSSSGLPGATAPATPAPPAGPVIVAPRQPQGDLHWPTLTVVDAAGHPVAGVAVDFTVCTQDTGRPGCATASGTLDASTRTIGPADPLLARTIALPPVADLTWVSVEVEVLDVPGGPLPTRAVLRAHWDPRSDRWLDNDGRNDDEALTWSLSWAVPPPTTTPPAPPPPGTTPPVPAVTVTAPRPTTPPASALDAGVGTAVGARPTVARTDTVAGPPPAFPRTADPAPVPSPSALPSPRPAPSAEAPAPPPRPPSSTPPPTPVARPGGALADVLASPLAPMLGGAAVAVAVILAAFPPAGPGGAGGRG